MTDTISPEGLPITPELSGDELFNSVFDNIAAGKEPDFVDETPAIEDPVVEPLTEPEKTGDEALELTDEVAPVVEEQPKNPEIEALLARIAALEAAEKQPKIDEKTPEITPKQEELPVYTADEEKLLTQYQTDWPDIVKGEALTRRKEYQELVKYVFDAITQRYDPALEYMQTSSSVDQYSAIVNLVPDYDVVRDKALEWIQTQPEFLKKAYMSVAETGTPAEVAEMLNRYKKETNYAAPSTEKHDTSKVVTSMPPATSTQPNKAKTAAAAALKVVPSGRTSTGTNAVDTNDFESAFKEAAKAARL